VTYVIMVAWTFSFLPFLFVLTATKGVQEISVVLHQPENGDEFSPSKKEKGHQQQQRGMLSIIFTTEIWSLIFSVLTQDGPYAAVRIYAVVRYNLITYSILYFICKNLLVVVLVLYRLFVICIHKHFNNDDDDDKSKKESNKTDKNANGSIQAKGLEDGRLLFI
jgi:hypothetical protein